MAIRASSPVRSPTAAVKVSCTRRKHRSTSSTNSAFLVGNRRNRYGWLMPACRATSSVEVPASPWTANSATAASRTSSRRSAAGIRCLVSVMTTKLVMTHYFVKQAGQAGSRRGQDVRHEQRILGPDCSGRRSGNCPRSWLRGRRSGGDRVVDGLAVLGAPVGADDAGSHLVHHVGDRHAAADVHDDHGTAPAAPVADLLV